MTGHDLKVWLVTHGYTQKQLAVALGVSLNTVNTYCNATPPKVVVLALDGLIKGKE